MEKRYRELRRELSMAKYNRGNRKPAAEIKRQMKQIRKAKAMI